MQTKILLSAFTALIIGAAALVGVSSIKQPVRLSPQAAGPGQVDLILSRTSPTLPPNSTITATLKTGTNIITAVDATFVFNPSKLQITGVVTTSSILTNRIALTSVENANISGRLNVTVALSGQDTFDGIEPKGDIDIASFTLTPKDTTPSTDTVTIDSVYQVVGKDNSVYQIVTTPVSLSINPASATPVPTSTPRPIATSTPRPANTPTNTPIPSPTTTPNLVSYFTELTGANEVPPVSTSAYGNATLLYNPIANSGTIYIDYTGLTGPITSAHIHGPDGSIYFTICSTTTTCATNVGEKSVSLTAPEELALQNNQTYLNLHTTQYPSGEIRGTLVADGTVIPTATPRPVATATPRPYNTPTPTPRPIATSTPRPSSTPIPGATSTPRPTNIPVNTPFPTDIPASGETIITLSGLASNQDGNQFASGSDMAWLGNGEGDSWSAIRFEQVNLPKGAKILSARLEVSPKFTQWIDTNTQLRTEKVDNSIAFSTSALPSQRKLSTSFVDQKSNDRWLQGTNYLFADVANPVQEVVNLSNWKPGNSMSLVIKGTGSQWARKFIVSRGDLGPKLVIKYKIDSVTVTIPRYLWELILQWLKSLGLY